MSKVRILLRIAMHIQYTYSYLCTECELCEMASIDSAITAKLRLADRFDGLTSSVWCARVPPPITIYTFTLVQIFT